jgi:hypothetical protein
VITRAAVDAHAVFERALIELAEHAPPEHAHDAVSWALGVVLGAAVVAARGALGRAGTLRAVELALDQGEALDRELQARGQS